MKWMWYKVSGELSGASTSLAQRHAAALRLVQAQVQVQVVIRVHLQIQGRSPQRVTSTVVLSHLIQSPSPEFPSSLAS